MERNRTHSSAPSVGVVVVGHGRFAAEMVETLLSVVGDVDGDADGDVDGDVDGDDFLAWQGRFGTTSGATHMQGDADGDEDVASRL